MTEAENALDMNIFTQKLREGQIDIQVFLQAIK